MLFLLAGIILGGIGLHVLFGGAVPVIPVAGEPLWEIALTFIVFILQYFSSPSQKWLSTCPRSGSRKILSIKPSCLLVLCIFSCHDSHLHVCLQQDKRQSHYCDTHARFAKRLVESALG